ncbi:MAG TPA: FAD-dependent oxidoreductase [Stenotrophomonas sp.]|jgi:glycine/D-amino acid oxidase-like deaminating enzyme/nitrite reductase/ring-hydroxylating ferredoxin subunit
MSTALTHPLWQVTPRDDLLSDALPATADVVVIGAGIAGLVTALNCAQDGRSVVVVERDRPGAGESGRTTAHLASALDDRYHALARLHGEEGAQLAAASHAAAIDWIEAFASPRKEACGFRRIPGYLFTCQDDVRGLRAEAQAAAKAGLSCSYLEQGIPGLPALGPAVRFEAQARVDMGRLLDALVQACVEAGVQFFRGNAVKVSGGELAQVTLDSGQALRAGAAVVASNVPFHERIAIHTKQAPYRTYVVAGPVEADAWVDALIWDDGDPYHYVRLAEDPDSGQTMVIVGGEDHKTGQSDDTEAFPRLQQWAREHLPGVSRFTHGWSGQVLEPADSLAFIGADPGGEQNVYVITGDSGNGVTHGTLGGLLVADLIAGRANPWAALYAPDRKILKGGREWLRENANVAAQYRDWVAPGDSNSDALARGEGAVVRRGVHRVATYRDGDGTLHEFNARCPHLGCAVHWSPQEKSWDCPCHGSRFEAQTGQVLNGPANEPLSPWESDQR